MEQPLNREQLQKVSRLRLKEANALINAGFHSGAYYLAGYSVECALKACIARRTQRYDFPDKKAVADAWTHDLGKLLDLAGIARDFERDVDKQHQLGLNWAVVKNWKVEHRYSHDTLKVEAKEIYYACVSRKYGVLTWITKRW